MLKGKRVQFTWSGALHIGLCTFDGSCSIGHRLAIDVDTLDGAPLGALFYER